MKIILLLLIALVLCHRGQHNTKRWDRRHHHGHGIKIMKNTEFELCNKTNSDHYTTRIIISPNEGTFLLNRVRRGSSMNTTTIQHNGNVVNGGVTTCSSYIMGIKVDTRSFDYCKDLIGGCPAKIGRLMFAQGILLI